MDNIRRFCSYLKRQIFTSEFSIYEHSTFSPFTIFTGFELSAYGFWKWLFPEYANNEMGFDIVAGCGLLGIAFNNERVKNASVFYIGPEIQIPLSKQSYIYFGSIFTAFNKSNSEENISISGVQIGAAIGLWDKIKKEKR